MHARWNYVVAFVFAFKWIAICWHFLFFAAQRRIGYNDFSMMGAGENAIEFLIYFVLINCMLEVIMGREGTYSIKPRRARRNRRIRRHRRLHSGNRIGPRITKKKIVSFCC